MDRGGAAAPVGRWGLAEIEPLFALWHRFKAGEFDGHALRRRLIPLQARLGRLLRRGQESPDRKAAADRGRWSPVKRCKSPPWLTLLVVVSDPLLVAVRGW